MRLLRRAINGLALAADSRAVGDVVRLAIYAPSLTPNLMRYLRSVGNQLEADDDEWDEIAEAVDLLARDVALNAWANLWLVDVIRDLKLLDENPGSTEAVNRRARMVGSGTGAVTRWRFGASPAGRLRRAAKPPSLAQHRIKKLLLHQAAFRVRGTPGVLDSDMLNERSTLSWGKATFGREKAHDRRSHSISQSERRNRDAYSHRRS